MPRQPTQAEVFDDLLARYEREIADAFRAAVDDLGAQADLAGAIEALSRNDIAGALEALHIDPAAFNGLQDAIARAYGEGGTSMASIAARRTPAGVVIRFDGRNPRAEAWLRQNGAALVTRIIQDQRTAIRNALVAGMERGQNPRAVALDVVGRINRATGKREGGVIGLTEQQEGFARTARGELRSGDPAALRRYLERARRDKRFDRSVQKAIRTGEPLPADTAAKAEAAYRNRLLQLRGETIGRTEALTSLQASKFEAMVQAVESGQVDEAAVRKSWRSAGDLRVRDTHRALHGDSVGLREPFRSPSGARLMFPGDPSAPVAETIQCRCDVNYRIDFLANIR
ncbi:MAG: phage minor head protein [Caulobacter sp.]